MVRKGQHFRWEAKVSLLVFGKILPDRVHCARVLGTRIPSYYRSRKSALCSQNKVPNRNSCVEGVGGQGVGGGRDANQHRNFQVILKDSGWEIRLEGLGIMICSQTYKVLDANGMPTLKFPLLSSHSGSHLSWDSLELALFVFKLTLTLNFQLSRFYSPRAGITDNY